jgi:arylsulfatase A-like enzyme
MTRFSVPVLMSGRYFSELERTGGSWPRVLPSNALLAESMSEAGYHTSAFHSIGYLLPLFGMDQGFDTYDVSVIRDRDPVHWNPTSDLVTDRILAYFDDTIAQLDGHPPWFLWAYYGDPHAGFQQHEGVRSFGPSLADLYDHEILFTDMHIGRLLDGMEKRGLLGNTAIVLTSDHGEGLNPDADHGYSYHGQTLFDNVLRVPLVFVVPGASPSVVTTSVGNVDVMPTLLSLVGLPVPRPLHGVSLVPYIEGSNPTHPPVFAEKVTTNVLPQKSMLKWPYKLIWKLGINKFELYDIASDPAELHELSNERPDALTVLKTEFQIWRATVLKEIPAKDG